MNNEKIHHCGACGQEQQLVGEIRDYIYCERCGAKIYGDGSCSYDGDSHSMKEMDDRIRQFDYDRDDYDRRNNSGRY